MKTLHHKPARLALTIFCIASACGDVPAIHDVEEPPILPAADANDAEDSGATLDLDAGQDAEERTCKIIPGRIVMTGDSLMTLTAAIVAGQTGRVVETQAAGGMTTTTLPDVPGPPATVVVGFGANDLLRLPRDAGGLTPQELAEEIDENTRAWVARQTQHKVIPPLAVTRLDPDGGPAAGYSPLIDATRRALNQLREEQGAASLTKDRRVGDEADAGDRTCYGADRIHLSVECHVHRAQYVVRALTRCGQETLP